MASKDRVYFLSKGQVFTVTLAADVKPEPLMKVRGQASQLTLSPDGGDHSFIGLYDAEAKSVRWLSSSVDFDAAPAFSPDGKAVAFVRAPSSRDRNIFGPKREGIRGRSAPQI